MTKNIFALIVVLIAFLPSCKSSKQVVECESDPYVEEASAAYNGIDSLLQKASRKESKEVVEHMVERFSQWNTVMLSAQLQMDGLPLSPSVKIFMEKNERFSVSVRAPFLGEIGRLECANDTVKAFNKMKGVYAVVDISRLMGGVEFSMADLQDLLLARAFMIGDGTIAEWDKTKINVYHYKDGDYYLMPTHQGDSLIYGFIIGKEGEVDVFTVHDFSSGFEFNCSYNYSQKSYDVIFEAQYSSTNIQAILSDVTCQWDAKPMTPINVTSKMKEVSLQEFLKF